MHNKRAAISKSWPIPRKGTKYLIVPSHNKKFGIPLLVLMREVLGLVRTRKELKKILLEKKVLVNGVPVREENYALGLFDTLSLKEMKKNFRVTYTEAGKIDVEEISAVESTKKITKVLDKKILKKNIVQVNMIDGRNIISKEKLNVGDSIVVNLKDKKIEKILPVKEKSKVIVLAGKYKGKQGTISKVTDKEIEISTDGKELKINLDSIMVLN